MIDNWLLISYCFLEILVERGNGSLISGGSENINNLVQIHDGHNL